VNTADYFNVCGSSVGAGVPENGFGFQIPKTGNAYAGFYGKATVPFAHDPREYLGAQLTSTLITGQRYYVSFYVSLNYPNCYTNKVGVLFTNTFWGDTNGYYNLMGYPSALIKNFSHVYTDMLITDTSAWTKVSGSFVADSAYKYFMIGNFFEDSHIDSVLLEGTGCTSYYYVDDVCVSTDSLACGFSVGINELQKTGVTLFPNPFSNQLTFKLADNEPTTVSLYDFLGQQILQHTFTNSTTINTAQMQSGIYFYELRNSKGTLKTGKVVKE
jgi:hypothetical protein